MAIGIGTRALSTTCINSVKLVPCPITTAELPITVVTMGVVVPLIAVVVVPAGFVRGASPLSRVIAIGTKVTMNEGAPVPQSFVADPTRPDRRQPRPARQGFIT